MSARRLFLKQLGLAVASLAVLPSVAEVDKILSEKHEGDPFWHIRDLMGESKNGWEYHCLFRKDYEFLRDSYTVMLLQNGNIHRETFYVHPKDEFLKLDQENLFKRLMHGVDHFNSLPVEKQQQIRDIMENNRRYHL